MTSTSTVVSWSWEGLGSAIVRLLERHSPMSIDFLASRLRRPRPEVEEYINELALAGVLHREGETVQLVREK